MHDANTCVLTVNSQLMTNKKEYDLIRIMKLTNLKSRIMVYTRQLCEVWSVIKYD